MWLWDTDLRQLGFRRKSEGYWQAERCFGLGACDHLSIFSWSEQTIPGPRRAPPRFLVELTEFHVTFQRGGEHLHFYYHERADNEWLPAGHTSGRQIRRLGLDRAGLRAEADACATALVAALGGTYQPRPPRRTSADPGAGRPPPWTWPLLQARPRVFASPSGNLPAGGGA
jgi:hypothetical protein